MRVIQLVTAVAALSSRVSAWSQEWQSQYSDVELGLRGHAPMPGRDSPDEVVSISAVPTKGQGYFKQLVDHNNASKGTFDQFYYWSNEFWKGPGSPVVLFTPGEVNGSAYGSYLTINRTSGVIAQEIGAAIFVIEHRYWGKSSPYPDLTTANLQSLTLENSILDFTYFANNIKTPWNSSNASITASVAPWVMTGGSYSGALSAWTESVAPGTFWAYHASSAPVEAISDYAGYFYPVQQGMAQNCSADINLVIEHMDDILTSGNDSEIASLKSMFKLSDIEHNDDFMAALENGPWLWQGNQLYTGYSPFFQFCDFVENTRNSTSNHTGPPPDANGVGAAKALTGYADWFSTAFLPNYCYETFGYDDFAGEYNTACFNTYNASSPLFTDRSLANTANRQWNWFLCNEPFGYWQDGAPFDRPTVVSRLVDAEYWIRQCDLFFPSGPNGETFGLAKNKTEADTNKYTKGWNDRNSTRLLYVNGEYDPWRDSGVSSDIRPGGPLQSTVQTPVSIVPGGFHCSDQITKNGQVNPGAQAVIDAEVKQLATWVKEWKGNGNANSAYKAARALKGIRWEA